MIYRGLYDPCHPNAAHALISLSNVGLAGVTRLKPGKG